MRTIDEFVNELNKNTNYEEMLVEIINIKDNDNIKKIFEEISENNELTEQQKEKIYNSIFDYSNEINKNFKKKIEDVHKRGFKEGALISLLIDSITRDDGGKRDTELNLAVEDFILERLKEQNLLEDSKEYLNNKNEIEKIKIECTTDKLKVIEKLNKLEELYEFKTDLEEIQAYKIGFRDALKFIINKTDKE